MRGEGHALFAYRKAAFAFRVRAEASALVIVDLQYGSAANGHGYQKLFSAIGYGGLIASYAQRVRRVVVPAVSQLQAAFRAAGAPIVYLTFGSEREDHSDMAPRFRRAAAYWRRLGLEPPYARPGSRDIAILDEVAPEGDEPVFVKTAASGFTVEALEPYLRSHGVTAVVVCGVTTSYCVESTLRDAADRGFDVVLVEDASAEIFPEAHSRGVRGCAAFGRVASAAELVAELATTDFAS